VFLFDNRIFCSVVNGDVSFPAFSHKSWQASFAFVVSYYFTMAPTPVAAVDAADFDYVSHLFSEEVEQCLIRRVDVWDQDETTVLDSPQKKEKDRAIKLTAAHAAVHQRIKDYCATRVVERRFENLGQQVVLTYGGTCCIRSSRSVLRRYFVSHLVPS
jgi:hypothetical protein